jgi:hypothetical protein
MFRTLIVGHAVAAIAFSVPMLAQQQPGSSVANEFPVTMRQNVDAGKTPVGTKIQTKLVVATLVSGVVIPRDAVLSGEVTESVAKTKTEPSRLSVRIDSAQWKNGSTPLKLYLTPWYYPPSPLIAQDLSYQSADAAKSPKNWNGMGTYPDPNNEMSQKKFPGRVDGRDSGPPTPDALGSNISKHRLLMKDVDSLRAGDGTVILSSKKSNLKLDKSTTYVLSGSDLLGSR